MMAHFIGTSQTHGLPAPIRGARPRIAPQGRDSIAQGGAQRNPGFPAARKAEAPTGRHSPAASQTHPAYERESQTVAGSRRTICGRTAKNGRK